VTDLVGAGASARIYQLHLPQTPTLEAVTFQQISGPRVHAFGSDPGLVQARFQVDSWGNTAEEAEDLAAATRGALSRWRGTVDSTVVQDSALENEIPFFEDEAGHYRMFQDYLIAFEE
jgi:hypothetical protein